MQREIKWGRVLIFVKWLSGKGWIQEGGDDKGRSGRMGARPFPVLREAGKDVKGETDRSWREA
jgi:hypothetical protein